MKIAFFGTPPFTIDFLEYLSKHNLKPTTIITGLDVPVGRKLQIESPLPKQWAQAHTTICYQPNKLDDIFIKTLEKENFDLFIVIAYGKILPEKLITLPKYGTINVHYSLLPKYRGATPVESAILNGDTHTGVCIQQMVYELDRGPVIASKEIAITPEDTTQSLRHKLNQEALPLLLESIKKITSSEKNFTIQNKNEQTLCKKIKKEDGLINLKDSAEILYRKYRAYNGWPGTYFFDIKHGKNMRIKIHKASYKKDLFIIEEVIPEGRKIMTWENYKNWK